MRRSVLVSLALCMLFSAVAVAQNREAMLLFKDGTHVKGKVFQNKDFFVDKTGINFIVPSGFLYFDDDVRKIIFSPAQVQEVMPLKTGERFKDSITLTRQPFVNQPFKLYPGSYFLGATEWDENWERLVKIKSATGKAPADMQQRIVFFNSERMQVMSRDYQYNPAYFTKEYTPDEIRKLLLDYAKTQKESKDWSTMQKRVYLAKFFQQLNWPELAEKELNLIVAEFPDKKDSVKSMLDTARSVVAQHQAEAIDRAANLGQHAFAQNRLEIFLGRSAQDIVPEKYQTMVLDWRTKYEALNEQVTLGQKLLKDLPDMLPTPKRDDWAGPLKMVKDELNLDTVDRLERFLTLGQQYVRDVADKKTPEQPLEDILALAVTGWLMGPKAAEADAKQAFKLYRGRLFLFENQRLDTALARSQHLDSYQRDTANEANVDVLARILKLMPPVAPHDKLDTEPQKLTIEGAAGGTYVLQLPPEYHHGRTYPVLVVLHGMSEKAEDTLARWKSLAAANGYILAAPLWSNGQRAAYSFTGKEHAIVLDMLRDLRRRFQVDSDRVFLFGWEQGGDMAFDVGIGHPDQFAGVLPVCGSPKGFVQRCWTNAQYLPFYVVEGGRNSSHPAEIQGVFKDWVRTHYPSIYFEYKGRGSEWYGVELPWMMDWMRNRKRLHPNRQMGVYHTGGGEGEEFKTMRRTDDRFYWLSTDHITDRCINDPANWSLISPAAKLQANTSVGNETNSKGEVKIWTQINVRTFGVKQVTLWLAPTMVDFSKPIQVRLNGTQVGFTRIIPPNLGVMLEELYRTGDRQKLVYAKVDMKM